MIKYDYEIFIYVKWYNMIMKYLFMLFSFLFKIIHFFDEKLGQKKYKNLHPFLLFFSHPFLTELKKQSVYYFLLSFGFGREFLLLGHPPKGERNILSYPQPQAIYIVFFI